mmetsp:Transcript_29071/g.92784  ORF Transcript_29071/g.92784 Transcript_29071/m.92784 type:complete len:214 (+) Transcript_29071:261-902(+)
MKYCSSCLTAHGCQKKFSFEVRGCSDRSPPNIVALYTAPSPGSRAGRSRCRAGPRAALALSSSCTSSARRSSAAAAARRCRSSSSALRALSAASAAPSSRRRSARDFFAGRRAITPPLPPAATCSSGGSCTAFSRSSGMGRIPAAILAALEFSWCTLPAEGLAAKGSMFLNFFLYLPESCSRGRIPSVSFSLSLRMVASGRSSGSLYPPLPLM